MSRFPHLAQQLFNRPLAIHPRKAEIIVAALAERMGIAQIQLGTQTLVIRPQAMEDEAYAFNSPGQSAPCAYDVVGGVAIIEISGTLVHKLGTLRPYSGMTGYDGIRQNFLMALTDPNVEAICLSINSPGGDVSGCFDLVDTIYEARGRKPVWSILDDSAYSAAYAIASASDRIVVPRTGGVGSIGVIAMHVDWSQALDKAGLKVTIFQHGARKADGAAEIPLAPEAVERFMADVHAMGDLFDATVARNRGLSADAVRAFEAITFMGETGVSAGLADAVMPPDAAFRALLSSLA